MLFIVEEHSLLHGTNDHVVFHTIVESIGPCNAFSQANAMKVLTGAPRFLYTSEELVEVEPDFLWAASDGSDNYVEVRKVR